MTVQNRLKYRLRYRLLLGMLICYCSISATTVRAGTMTDLYAGMTAFKVVESFSIRDFTITRDAATIELE
jgi:hypothetical protein